MKAIGFLFLVLAALCATAGMVWGIVMAASQDHTMVAAHAHLNLVGWVTLALFGIYYRLTPQAAAAGLARVHLAVATLGIAALVPGIVIAVSGGSEVLVILGSVVTMASMLIFLYTVIRRGFGPAA